MIPVTIPFLPDKKLYQTYIDQIWDRQWLTNNGPLVNELEDNISSHLASRPMTYVCNGTIALQIAIKALDLKGEVITTPFSFIATTSSLLWEDCTPIFVDIDPHTLNIDPKLIESKITNKTSAILATHVFGNPVEHDQIQDIANKYNLKILYDAAHAFGCTLKNTSVMNLGDISITSFHATKLYHSTEGGGIFCDQSDLIESVKKIRNFGYSGPYSFDRVGINGKNSEFHAAMGLVNLQYIDQLYKKRKDQYQHYKNRIKEETVRFQSIHPDCDYNCAYFPIILEEERQTERLVNKLNENRIFPRRYFYPSLNASGITEYQPCPESEQVSSNILCLPLYHQLTKEDQDFVIKIWNKYSI